MNTVIVYKTESGLWAFIDRKGYGFTNQSLRYILDYLDEKEIGVAMILSERDEAVIEQFRGGK